MFGTDIGIDLGTANVLVYVKGKGIVIQEPSVVAFEKKTKRVVAIGQEAKDMIGKTPNTISVVRPLKQGVISDYSVAEKMIKEFIKQALSKKVWFFKPHVCICVPSGVTEVEKKAVEDAVYRCGVSQVYIIEEPIAAAIGANINIEEPCGNMVVDIGGGTTDVAVISLGGTVVSTSLKVAGDDFNEAIVKYVRRKHNILIGEGTAESVKCEIGSVYDGDEEKSMEVRGRNLVNGLPIKFTLTSSETREALEEVSKLILDAIHGVLEIAPPELAADISCGGITLSGGGSLIGGLDKLVEEHTGIKTTTLPNALTAVALGTGISMEQIGAGKK